MTSNIIKLELLKKSKTVVYAERQMIIINTSLSSKKIVAKFEIR